jgi:hypothetical protein
MADKTTVNPGLRPKRGKRPVENHDFDAFARRIVRAYARRVAAGDIEALTALRLLTSAVDTATAEAVQGLRRFGYSWNDISTRLGVSRQAAQTRWGERGDRGRLDPRILDQGLGVSVAQLVTVYIDHHPGSPVPATCPQCAYEYPDGIADCPTLRVVRPLLYQRRHEDRAAVSRLTPDQLGDLHHRRHARPAERTSSASPRIGSREGLFDHTRGGHL